MTHRSSYVSNTHRSQAAGMRILEILESLKTEYDTISRDVNLYKLQRDEYERKLQQQYSEAQSIQQQLMDLDRNFHKMKQKYEEEISFLRRQLGANEDTSPSGPIRNTLTGEKRPLSSVELSTAQDLGNLTSENPPAASAKRLLPSLNANLSPVPAQSVPPVHNGNPLARFIPSFPNNSTNSNPPPMPPKPTPKKSPDLQKPLLAPSSPLQSTSTNNITVNNPVAAISNPGPGTTNISVNPPPPPPPPSMNSPFMGSPKASRKSEVAAENVPDWIVGYNPSVMNRKLEVALDHDLEHDSVVCCVNFSPAGKYLATGCNHTAQIYDVETGAKIHTFNDKPELETDLYIRSVCFSPDSTLLATGVEDKTVKLWDIEKEQIKHNLTGHELDIYSLDFSSDGRLIISGSGDKKVKIWRIEDAKCISTLGDDQNGPRDGVTSVCITQDGHTIAAGSLDRIVRLWDIETGTMITQYEGHTDSVYSVAFAPDGKTLASGSLDKTVKLWDVNRTQKRCRVSLAGHRDFVLSVTFSPDGNWLVSGSKDRSVQFWDPRTSLTHMILQGHRNSVISVALTGEQGGVGKFATGSGDARARIWQWKT